MEYMEKKNAVAVRHSVLGIIAFVLPLIVIVTCLALFVVHIPELMESRLGYIHTFLNRYCYLLPVSFVCLLIGFAALKQPNTNKRMVKWGLTASAFPTLALVLEMVIYMTT